MREVRLALLEADVHFSVVKSFIARVRERSIGAEVSKALNPGQQVIKIVNDELIETLRTRGLNHHQVRVRNSDMETLNLRQYEALGPFEIKNELAALAQEAGSKQGLTYLNAGRGQDAYRCLLLVRRLHPENWTATVGLAALHARAQETDQARELLAEALQRGGDDARAFAAGFPVLAPLLEK